MLSKEERYLVDFENCDYFLDLGIHIAYYRKKAGFTQQKLADKLRIKRPYLSRIESPGQNQTFSFKLFFSICRILDTPPRYFFEPFPKTESR